MEMEPGQMKTEIPIRNNIYLKFPKTAPTMEIRKVQESNTLKEIKALSDSQCAALKGLFLFLVFSYYSCFD